jgi:hypothetical protein
LRSGSDPGGERGGTRTGIISPRGGEVAELARALQQRGGQGALDSHGHAEKKPPSGFPDTCRPLAG